MDINQIYLGDAYELIKQVPDKSVDLIVTDPPYEFGYKQAKRHYEKLLRKDGQNGRTT